MAWAARLDGQHKIKLGDVDTKQDGGMEAEAGRALRDKLGQELSEMQELLYAAGETGLLIVLQGMDTSGKDGTIRGAFNYMNPLGVRVASFKVPTPLEQSHDFLWRIHPQTPGKGEIAVFNRSHYEDVLVVRVHGLAAEKVWRARYEHINNFEKLLNDGGTRIVKFFLHISREEQEKRLLAREADTMKAWKLSVGDWQERTRWEDYQAAYEEALNRCATPDAPWYVVPADRKWFRDIAVLEALLATLRPFRDEWKGRLEKLGETQKAALAEYRKSGVK